VVGGTLQRGVLRVGDELELRPGLVTKEMGIIRCQPVRTRVQSCFSESTSLAAAVPGGLVAVGTKLDPVLSQKDNLVGQILGVPGNMPDIYIEIEVAVFLPSSLAAAATPAQQASKLILGEILSVNIGANKTAAKVMDVQSDLARLRLSFPTCATIGDKLTVSRRVMPGGDERTVHWRLIGWAKIMHGIPPILVE
jgi:translation initiation factor 2 subunit 3